jgi:hypothetical protein
LREPLEHSRTPLRVTACGHLADGLVIEQQFARGELFRIEVELTSVEAHFVVRCGPITELRHATPDRHAPIANPLLDATA